MKVREPDKRASARRIFRERRAGPGDHAVWLMDLNVVPLVRALNAFDGFRTVSSCGGHEDPGPTQYAAGSWYVRFEVEWRGEGQASLTLLTWLINNRAMKAGRNFLLFPYARSPRGNMPGRGLSFVLEGHHGEDPIALSRWLTRERARVLGGEQAQ